MILLLCFFSSGRQRNAIRATSRLWPGGVVYYTISPHFTAEERYIIARAFKTYHDETCIT